MSANNQVIVIEKEINKNYEVHENFCVDNDFIATSLTLLKKFNNLRDAITFANKYANDEMVEYGVHICLKSQGGKTNE